MSGSGMSPRDRAAAKRSISERPLVLRVPDGTIACATFGEIERAKRIGAGNPLETCTECGAWLDARHKRTCPIVAEHLAHRSWFPFEVREDQCRDFGPQGPRP